ncbi:hypothetical protein BGW38_005785, partial [Lunasporangiospora selenospora]
MQQHYPQFQQHCSRRTAQPSQPSSFVAALSEPSWSSTHGAPMPSYTAPSVAHPPVAFVSTVSTSSSTPLASKTTTPSPPPTPQHCQRHSKTSSTSSTASCASCFSSSSSCHSARTRTNTSSNSDVAIAPMTTPVATALPMLEFDIIHHPVKDTLLVVSSLVSTLVHVNDQQYNPLTDPITLFHSRAVPRISIEAYLLRILQYIPFTNEVLLNVLVYLDRIGGLEGMQLQRLQFQQQKEHIPVDLPRPQTTRYAREDALSTRTAISSDTDANQSYASAGHTCTPRAASASHSPRSTTCSSTASASSLPSSSTAHVATAPSPALSTSTLSTSSTISSHSGYSTAATTSSSTTTMTTLTVDTAESANSDAIPPMVPKRVREEGEHVDRDANLRHPLQPKRPKVSSPPTSTGPTAADTPATVPVGFNIHRLLITCLMVASKFTSDLFYSNARYAK